MPLGITVNCVAPGFIEDTDFNADFPASARADVLNETRLAELTDVRVGEAVQPRNALDL
jgi:NAD(P)-dependent dehydrogenase (short-subunit alcohol dehydrogenase family)